MDRPLARPASAWRHIALALAVGALLQGCGGGLGGSDEPDPVAVDIPVAYVKRPLPVDPNNASQLADPDLREVLTFTAGGDLYLRDRASATSDERNVTARFTGGHGDVRDVEVSYDGTKLLFAMRAPEIPGAAPEDQPTWNIWEYDIPTDGLRRVIDSDLIAELGQDIAPAYLPDGRIVFSSTRQQAAGAVLINEGKPIFSALDEDRNEAAFVLHVMDPDGGNIRQITFNQSHDLNPSVLEDGRIVFTRWERMAGRNDMHLFTVNPDGTELQILYGAHSHATGTNGSAVQFVKPQERPNGQILALIQAFNGTFGGGNLIAIDTGNYIDNDQPTWVNLGALGGPAQRPVTGLNITTDGTLSPGGRIVSFYPLRDGTNRALISWSPCRLDAGATLELCTPDALASPTATEAAPRYGAWMFDLSADTQRPIVAAQAGEMITDVVAAEPRPFPAVRSGTTDSTLASEGTAILHIRSVYDLGDGGLGATYFGDAMPAATLADLADPAQVTADQRPARFLRLIKAVSIPPDTLVDLDTDAFGVSAQNGMREILGYAPVDPDGSVRVKVPANVALTFDVVDGDGKRLSPRHRSWVQLRPGETQQCVGCHKHTTTPTGLTPLPHGRADAIAASINAGAQDPGNGAFPNTYDALYTDFGQTMAEVRTITGPLVAAALPTVDASGFDLEPSVDVHYVDVWNDPAKTMRASDATLTWSYADLGTPSPATSSDCTPSWSRDCRVVIHYPDHIQPLWERDRGANTCVSCHSPRDAANAIRVPEGQLNLTQGSNDDASDVAAHYKSYRELLAADNQQEIDGTTGLLQDIQIPVIPLQCTNIDPATGLPFDPADPNCILATQTITQPASMSVAGARASGRFFNKFATGGTHAGFLDAAELRLIAEWLDIGAQYYNDPFHPDVPLN